MGSTVHCGTHGACFSYHGLAIYVRYFVPLRVENHSQLSIYVRYFVPLQLENHTLVIHLCEIYSTPAVGNLYLSLFIYGEIFVLSEYEFQSHSSFNHQLFILKIAEPFIL